MSDQTRAKELFLALLELDGEARATELARLRALEPELAARVEGLLEAHGEAERWLAAPTATRRAAAPAPGTEIGDYRLEALLGEGGFGRVYRAEQLRPVRRRVALKLLKPAPDPRRVIARFEAERQLCSRLDHPHVARVLAAGESDDGLPYVVMELVEGPSITRYAAEHALGLRARVELLRQTALAIQHAHNKGVLHRDVKPSNVLVVEIDGQAQPRVIDFGIAKALGGEGDGSATLTADGHLVGTPAYMSPEQFGGRGEGSSDVDTRADVWALGVLLFELLVGRPPLEPDGIDLASLVRFEARLREEEPRAPSSALASEAGPGAVREAVPRELDWIVLRCLEKDPERRYASAAELAADLGRFLADLPVEAAPPSPTYRLRKLVRRHRAAALAGLLAVLALLAGVVGTSLALWRAAELNRALDSALARERAESEALRNQERVTRAVSDFLTRDVLASVRPEQGPRAREITMLEVLRRSASELEAATSPGGRLEGLATVEAGVRYAIGESLASLGEELEALPHAERAHQLLERSAGAQGEDTLRAALARARILLGLRRDAEAEELLRAILPRLEAALGSEAKETMLAREYLGRVLLLSRRPGEAAEVFREAHARWRAARGDDDAQTISLLFSLALATEQSGAFEEAGPLHEEAARRALLVLGPDAPNTLAARANLGMWLAKAERREEARALLAEVVERQRRVLGPRHSDVVAVLHTLAQLVEGAGEPDRARELYLEALAATEATRGVAHPTATRILTKLAWLAEGQGEQAEAERLFREALERARAFAGAEDPSTTGFLANLGSFYNRAGRLDEAEPLLREASRRLDLERGPGDEESVRAFDRLALLAARRGRVDEALALHREALARAAGLPSAHPARRGIHADIVNLLIDAERLEEALAAARTFHDELVSGLGPRGARVGEIATTVASLCRALGLEEEALAWDEDARRAGAAAD